MKVLAQNNKIVHIGQRDADFAKLCVVKVQGQKVSAFLVGLLRISIKIYMVHF